MAARRKTTQRELIKTLFSGVCSPMTADQVLQAAVKLGNLSQPTVYRNLALLCDDGWLMSFQMPGSRTRFFERVGAHHHHFLCRQCGTLSAVKCSPDILKRILPTGCELESHEIHLFGLCAACAALASLPDSNDRN